MYYYDVNNKMSYINNKIIKYDEEKIILYECIYFYVDNIEHSKKHDSLADEIYFTYRELFCNASLE